MPLEYANPQIIVQNTILNGPTIIPGDLTSPLYAVGSGSVQINVSSSVITSGSHERLRQLVHFVDQGPTIGQATFYKQVINPGMFPTTASWCLDAGFTQKFVEQRVVWANNVITQSIWQIWDDNGNPSEMITDVITYVSGIFESSRTRTIG